MPSIHVLSENRIIQCLPGENLREILQRSDCYVNSPCGGNGTCGKCIVRIEASDLPEPSQNEKLFLTEEELAAGYRLACETLVTQNIKVTLSPKQNPVDILAEGFLPEFEADDCGAPGTYGVAVDLGTTTMACCLVDLASGAICARGAGLNPQTDYGMDVLTRISYQQRHSEEGIQNLQQAVVSGLNDIIESMCDSESIGLEHITRMVVSGNCTMIHMLLGVDATSIGVAPFLPRFTEARELKAKQIGLSIPDADLYCLPSVSSYIGGDIVAGAYVCNLAKAKGNILFIDIGTNGELILSQRGKMNSCSCAAGPALEGMNIQCGMRGEPGAIASISIQNAKMDLEVIGEVEPIGICGSGILSSVSEFLQSKLLRKSGALVRKERIPEGDYRSHFLKEDAEGNRYILLYDGPSRVFITQKDIRQVQLAKGAILSGFRALLQDAELNDSDLDEVIVAGQFGAHIAEADLIGTGILPKGVAGSVRYVGNTSLTGAVMALLSAAARKDMEALAKEIHYMELGEVPEYQTLLAECMEFPIA